MSRRGYLLTDAAETDLRGIIRYTRNQWGNSQARRYTTALERGMARLAARQGAYKDMSDLYPSLCMAHCEHHYLFCLPREKAPALIVAIFHERMDLMVRLADRLRSDIPPPLAEAKSSGQYPLPPEQREWVDAPSVGREWPNDEN